MCDEVESEEHVLLDCNIDLDVRRWKEKLYIMIYYELKNDCIERKTIWYLGMVWKTGQTIGLFFYSFFLQ